MVCLVFVKIAKIDDSITLKTKWERNALKSLDLVKRKGKTAKKEKYPALCEELTLCCLILCLCHVIDKIMEVLKQKG